MKTLVLNHNIEGQGTWHRAWNFARQLKRHGHEVSLLAVNPRRSLGTRWKMVEGIRVGLTTYLGPVRLAASGLDPWDVLRRSAMVLAGAWDVLFAFSSLPAVGLPQLLARRMLPSRCIIADWDDLFCDGGGYEYLNHGWTRPIYRFERWLEISTKRQADGVTTTSEYLFEKARALREDQRVAYLPTGANVADIPRVEKIRARQMVPVPAGRIVLVQLSTGYCADNVLLLEALSIARRSCPELFLHLIGRNDPEYADLIRDLQLDGAVEMTGWVEYADLSFHLGAADILVMPLHDCLNSRARGPIKLRDYLCAGRPIVGTALGEVEYVLGHYKVGKLAGVPAASLAGAIVELATHPEEWEPLGREARRVAENDLSWDTIGDRVHAFVAECCRRCER